MVTLNALLMIQSDCRIVHKRALGLSLLSSPSRIFSAGRRQPVGALRDSGDVRAALVSGG